MVLHSRWGMHEQKKWLDQRHVLHFILYFCLIFLYINNKIVNAEFYLFYFHITFTSIKTMRNVKEHFKNKYRIKNKPTKVHLLDAPHWASNEQQSQFKHPKADVTKEQSKHHQYYHSAVLHSEAEAAGHFCPASSTAWKILPTLLPLWELLCFHSPKIKTAAMFPGNKCLTSWAGVNTDIMLTGSRGSHL